MALSDVHYLSTFRFWCQKVLPLVYDDSLSYYEVLCKCVDYINKLIENDKAMAEAILKNVQDIAQLKTEMEFVQSELEKIKNGGYMSVYIEALAKWIDANLQQMVARIVKYVYFGLTGNGHFAAYIPATWDFLGFDTIMQYDNPMYGHLVMYW